MSLFEDYFRLLFFSILIIISRLTQINCQSNANGNNSLSTYRRNSTIKGCSRSQSNSIHNVKDFGAKGDGLTKDTKAIQDALNSISKEGYGTLYFPSDGVYLTGSLNLTSNLIVNIESNATIRGSMDGIDWPLLDAGVIWPQFGHGSDCEPGTESCRLMHQALFFAWNEKNITFSGAGTIDANANFDTWWKCADDLSLSPCDNYSRPHLLMLSNTVDVQLSGIRFQNCPDWCLHFTSCVNVHIDSVTVLSPIESPNTDGIDIDCSKNILIENSYFSVGDDAIAIKSGIDYFGRLYNQPSRDIIYRNNVIEQGHGISIGSETSGSIFNVTFENISMKGTKRGPRIKSCRGRGGHVDNIVFRNITGQELETSISFDFNYASGIPPTNESATPYLSNIFLENLHFKNTTEHMGEFIGLKEAKFQNITMKNVITEKVDGLTYGKCENVVNATCVNMQDKSYCPPCFKFVS